MPINQIPFKLTQHPHVPFAITAGDNAIYEEYNAKERERQKKEKIDIFNAKATIRHNQALLKLKNPAAFKLFEEHIKTSLKTAIEFSLKTNMIKKSGTNVDHDDLAEINRGPPTFNGTDRDYKFNDTHRSASKHRNVDLHELQSALEDGKEKTEIIAIIDKIIDERDSAPQRNSEKKNAHNYENLSPEEIKRNETPDFDYTKLQGQAGLLGIPPRDFDAYIPLLRILQLENYDRNEFEKFDMVESLKLLKQLWKTSNHDKIEYLLNYGIFHEVMRVEERKAVRRNNLENEIRTKEELYHKSHQEKLKSKYPRSDSPFVRINDLDSQKSKAETDGNKQGEENKGRSLSKPPSSHNSEQPKKSIKKWDSKGKDGGIKMDSTR